MKKVPLIAVVPLITALLFTALLGIEFYKGLDSRLYDLLLRARPAVEQDDRLLLVKVDDLTITNINMYPLGRDIFADGLILMKEFGAEWAIFDIEFVDRSPAGINLDFLEQRIPEEFEQTFGSLAYSQEELFAAVAEGRLPLADAMSYSQELSDSTYRDGDRLLSVVNNVARDNDVYLGQAVAYFGNVTATLNMMDDQDATVPDSLRSYVAEHLTINDHLSLEGDPFSRAVEIKPTIAPILESAEWAGFPRVFIDGDGVRRRVDLLFENKGNYYTQLGFGTWWSMNGKPDIRTTSRRLQVGDRSIPLATDGRMLVNWPKGTFLESFRHLSFYQLYFHDQLAGDLMYNLRLMEEAGLAAWPYYEGDRRITDLWQDLDLMRQDMLARGDSGDVALYRELRDSVLESTKEFLTGDAESYVQEDLQSLLQDPTIVPDDIDYYQNLMVFSEDVFSASRDQILNLIDLRSDLDESLAGSIAVMGYSGTSTTDFGVNPFEKGYMNMGLYAAVFNTIEQGEFLRDVPVFVSGLAALLVASVALVAVMRLKTLGGVGVGLGITVVAVAVLGMVFVFTGIYVSLLPAVLATTFTYMAAVISNFLKESKDKTFIKGAFSHYLSTDVIKEIIDDPDSLKLGGEEKVLTAMFTDIQGFSSISEKLTPTELVSLLNTYLTAMSDIVLEQRGTIDKYEGDAIIAFWGAPAKLEDHAYKACKAALSMKRAEDELNRQIIEAGVSPNELNTRIGINTGPMVVGNMGTLKKMDYTIMGSAVNLAARLEGVNKQYGTRILISSDTEKLIHPHFITRELDIVRVVGIKTPVTLYELSCFKEDFTESMRASFNLYRHALEHFRAKEWKEAEDHFKKVLEEMPGDGPATTFLERCAKYAEKPPAKNWDGVYNLVSK